MLQEKKLRQEKERAVVARWTAARRSARKSVLVESGCGVAASSSMARLPHSIIDAATAGNSTVNGRVGVAGLLGSIEQPVRRDPSGYVPPQPIDHSHAAAEVANDSGLSSSTASALALPSLDARISFGNMPGLETSEQARESRASRESFDFETRRPSSISYSCFDGDSPQTGSHMAADSEQALEGLVLQQIISSLRAEQPVLAMAIAEERLRALLQGCPTPSPAESFQRRMA